MTAKKPRQPIPQRHWRSYGNDPLPTPAEAQPAVDDGNQQPVRRSTPTASQSAVDPVERAAAYGFPGETVDGNDAEAMFEATRSRPRAGARRRGPDAARGRDDAHARSRRPRRHEVRAEGAGRGVAPEGPDRPPGGPRARGRGRHRGAARGDQAGDRRGHPGGPRDGDARPGTATHRLFHDEADEIRPGDGNAPWSGFAGGAS